MIYLLTTSLPEVFGGRTKSLLRRIDLLTRHAGIPCTVVTAVYRADYSLIYESYYKRGFVPRSVRFLNVYDDLYRNTASPTPAPNLSHWLGRGFRFHVKHPPRNLQWCFSLSGRLTHILQYEEDSDTVSSIRYMDKSGKTKYLTRELDTDGRCHRERRFPVEKPGEIVETLYDKASHPYLELTKKRTGDGLTITDIYDLRSGNHFDNVSDFLRDALPRLLGDAQSVIVDTRFWDGPVLDSRQIKAKKVFVLHNPHRSRGKIKLSYRKLLKKSAKATAVVLLTQGQKADWISDGGADSACAIPHSIEPAPGKPSLRRDPNKVVCISRLAEQKQIHHAIKAFALVAQTHPLATLDIFGSGPTRQLLEQTIRECGLAHRCFLRGRTDNPQAVLASAACSLHTSLYEGQCLSVLESLAEGCPAVSYDVSYGPGEMISDGVSGFLVPRNEISALAQAISKVLDGWTFAVTVPERFRDQAFIEAWRQLLKK